MIDKNKSNKNIKTGYGMRTKIANAIIYVILTVLALIWIFPLVWLILQSFRAEKGAYTTYILPKNYTFNNYIKLFTETDLFNYPRWFMNTLVVAIFTCILSTLMILGTSYTFSRLRFKSRKPMMNVALILGMFPGFMSMTAVYHILKSLQLDQSLIALVIVYSGGSALGFMISKGFFDTIPKALDEAATIDGATKSQIFWKITLPLSKPIITYTVLTSFLAPWVDFIFVSVIMKDNYQNYTIALGLYQMLTRENVNAYFTQFCAGAVLVAIPITILFIYMQKYYVEGITGGSVKG
ncbi:Maltose transport system permease protein MalG [Clostridium sp. N3C]|uniref:sugar ABC transporter permease n=1 Tax=Clostridium sp. N3C TaxID=1776758 RepID=UPI00092DF4BB|nr:Maltose transport system permease protein MalG [Clostridium sp. N3C]